MEDKWKLYKSKWKTLWKNFFFYCCIPSFFCYIFVEFCSRKSILDVVLFFLKNPFVFLYNVLIIAVTTSICLLVKRRTFTLVVVLSIWSIISVTDMILLLFRTTPFTAVDLFLIKNALSIIDLYLSPVAIVLIILGVLAVIAFCIYLFFKAKKEVTPIDYINCVPFCILLCFGMLTLTNVGMEIGLLDRNFGNLAQAFHDNGLPYCFMNSVLNTGVEKPEDYSADKVEEFVKEIEEDTGIDLFEYKIDNVPFSIRRAMKIGLVTFPKVEKLEEQKMDKVEDELEHIEDSFLDNVQEEQIEISEKEEVLEENLETEIPNIIFLQLESFFDVNYIENFSCTENPVSFFTYLKEQYSSGFLSVPSIGAGTANTEFECITGMNLDFFGPGEYPYKTILKERTCESFAYNLKSLGLSASAIHNNDGTFYDRHIVFSNLGFDRFVSIEYMEDAKVNLLNWAEDKVLTEEIMEVLKATKERDYIYTVSVQGHGAYPEEPLLSEPLIDVHLPEELSEYYYQYLYYVNQIYEMDLFLKELVFTLDAWQEDVILVLYGDHLPSLGLEEGLLKNRDLFQTEYVIWSNFPMEKQDKDLQAYQLSARVSELLGIEEGVIIQYHQHYEEEADYLEKMQLLMYDMLYGEMEVYEGKNPFEPTQLQMGVQEISIENIYLKKSQLTEDEPMVYVSGQNFTEWSKVAINGEVMETIFLNTELLAVAGLPKKETEIYEVMVRQQGNDGIALSETIIYKMEVD